MYLFQQRLIEELGIAETRAPSIAEGMEALFNALAQLDNKQFGIIKRIGLEKLMDIYSATEEQRMLFCRPKWRLKDNEARGKYKRTEFMIMTLKGKTTASVVPIGKNAWERIGEFANTFEARLAVEDWIDKKGDLNV